MYLFPSSQQYLEDGVRAIATICSILILISWLYLQTEGSTQQQDGSELYCFHPCDEQEVVYEDKDRNTQLESKSTDAFEHTTDIWSLIGHVGISHIRAATN